MQWFSLGSFRRLEVRIVFINVTDLHIQPVQRSILHSNNRQVTKLQFAKATQDQVL